MKIGRPLKDDPKNINLKLRLNRETADRLRECADTLGVSRTAIIERGIRRVAEECGKDMQIRLRVADGECWEGALRRQPSKARERKPTARI